MEMGALGKQFRVLRSPESTGSYQRKRDQLNFISSLTFSACLRIYVHCPSLCWSSDIAQVKLTYWKRVLLLRTWDLWRGPLDGTIALFTSTQPLPNQLLLHCNRLCIQHPTLVPIVAISRSLSDIHGPSHMWAHGALPLCPDTRIRRITVETNNGQKRKG